MCSLAETHPGTRRTSYTPLSALCSRLSPLRFALLCAPCSWYAPGLSSGLSYPRGRDAVAVPISRARQYCLVNGRGQRVDSSAAKYDFDGVFVLRIPAALRVALPFTILGGGQEGAILAEHNLEEARGVRRARARECKWCSARLARAAHLAPLVPQPARVFHPVHLARDRLGGTGLRSRACGYVRGECGQTVGGRGGRVMGRWIGLPSAPRDDDPVGPASPSTMQSLRNTQLRRHTRRSCAAAARNGLAM